ncbi:Uncharacterised protein [Staphylococcus aureus]|nr:Uncharacterised protein [Staphylococcus aureus]SCT74989.1 Uncharacterised protein [Staphylococcus aureus]
MSIITDPFFICLIMSSVTSLGALAPGIKTAPITKSLCLTYNSIFNGFDIIVCTRPPNKSSNCCKRFGLTSKIVTSAPSPSAILAAFVPA